MYNLLKDFQITLVAVIVALAVIFSAIFVAGNLKKDEISVTGSAYKIVKSDTASLSMSVTAYNSNKSAAYAEIKRQIPVVLEYLKKNGITQDEITLLTPDNYPTYQTNPNTGYSTNNILGYNFSQAIEVKSKNVDKIKELSTTAQDLLEKNVNINMSSPQYYYSKLSEIKIELLKSASEDAKMRAKGMLSATGNNVGKICSVKMGVFQITPPDSTDVSDSGMNDTTSVNKKVTAVANVIFKIK